MASKIISGKTRERTTSVDYKRENIESYDVDNSYPERVRDLVNASGVASACTEIFGRYTFGDGIADINQFNRVVDREGTTLDKLMRKCIDDYALWFGFAIHVQYNAFGEPISYKHVPFEYVRKGILKKESLFGIYDNWDKRDVNRKYNTEDIVWVNRYNPANVVNEIAQCEGKDIPEKISNYKGQLFWYSRHGKEYPLAPCDPVLEDVRTNYEIKIFKNKNIRTNFMASHMFVYRGTFADDQAREDYRKQLELFQGAESVGNIMLVEAEQPESIPQLLPFTIQNNDKLWEFTEQSTINNIVQNYLIPPVLIGINIAGKLGTANEINDAHTFYNNHTEFDRLIFAEEFSRLMGAPISLVPKKQIYTLTA